MLKPPWTGSRLARRDIQDNLPVSMERYIHYSWLYWRLGIHAHASFWRCPNDLQCVAGTWSWYCCRRVVKSVLALRQSPFIIDKFLYSKYGMDNCLLWPRLEIREMPWRQFGYPWKYWCCWLIFASVHVVDNFSSIPLISRIRELGAMGHRYGSRDAYAQQRLFYCSWMA